MKTAVFRREAIALPEEDFGLVTFCITADVLHHCSNGGPINLPEARNKNNRYKRDKCDKLQQ